MPIAMEVGGRGLNNTSSYPLYIQPQEDINVQSREYISIISFLYSESAIYIRQVLLGHTVFQ